MVSEGKNKNKKQINLVWKAFTKGRRWAFEEIYKQTFDDLYRFGIKFLNHSESIKDIIHDLYFKLWQRRDNLSTPTNLKAYLLSSLRATIINHINQENRRNNEFNKDNFDFQSSAEDFYISQESTQRNYKVLNEELNKLTAKQKEAIYLHYIQEFDYKEVAEIMSVKVQSVRNLVYEGIVKLKNARDKFVR